MEKINLNCKLHDVKVADVSDRFYSFEGYASTFGNIDLGNDIVQRGAFLESIEDLKKNSKPIPNTQFAKLMPVLWQHSWDEPIGSFVEMREDDRGLYVKGILPKSDDFVKGRVIPQMETGSISDMSIGFMIQEQTYDGEIRTIEKATLYETSLVTIPMNPKAHVTNFKSAAPFKDLPVATRGLSIEDMTGKAYLWEDKESGDALLPIAGVIDGKMQIIPELLFKAAAFVATKSDQIPAKDLPEVIGDINNYYKKAGMDCPFKDVVTFRLDDEKSLSERELESLLCGGVSFSQKMAKKIIALFNDDAQRDADVKSQRDADLKETLNKLLNTL